MGVGRRRIGWGVAAVVVAGGLMTVGAIAQGPQQPGTAGQSTEGGKVERSMSDMEFLNHAIMADHTAIDMAKLALSKGSSAEVKQTAQTVVTTHTEMLDQLQQVAQTMGWKHADGAGPRGKQMLARLQRMEGAEFDQAFLNDMIELHKREAGLFEAEAGNAQNEPLMKVAGDQLPMIRQHLQELEQMKKGGPKG